LSIKKGNAAYGGSKPTPYKEKCINPKQDFVGVDAHIDPTHRKIFAGKRRQQAHALLVRFVARRGRNTGENFRIKPLNKFPPRGMAAAVGG